MSQWWLDGRPLESAAVATTLGALSRAVAYGDGLFETVHVHAGRAPLLPLHVERLLRDCARLRIRCDAQTLQAEVAQALAGRAHGVLKILVIRAGFERGYAAPCDAAGRRLLHWSAVAQATPLMASGPAVLRLCRQRLALQPTLAGIKHLNRLEQVLARAEWSDPDITEGLMLDTLGRVIEAVSSNVFCVHGNRIATPALDGCGVRGVMRQVVVAHLDVPVQESTLTLDDLYSADEVFITSTQRGIQAVTQLGCVAWPVGSVTIALQQRLAALLALPHPFV